MSLIGFSAGRCRSPKIEAQCPMQFCDCDCHQPGSNMKHFMACCHLGTCPVCNEVMDRVSWIMPVKDEDKNEPVED